MSENTGTVHLYCFPLEVTRGIKTLSGMNCFHLIWLKCCFTHSFTNIIITKKDRERIQFPWISYMRGLEYLEKHGFVVVVRKIGRLCRISLNVDLLDQKSKDFILKGRK